MDSKKILLIEDDISLQNLIDEYLKEYKYFCTIFSSPRSALEEFSKNANDYSLVILDLGLPEMDGFDLLKKLKEIKDIPVIISTARDDLGNKIFGFELGADDYLAKPYEPRELVLRIDAILKRYVTESSYIIGSFKVQKDTNQVFLDNNEIEFTKIENEIFMLLLNNANKIISREVILNQTSLKNDTKNRTIDMHISNIRFKIDDDSKDSKHIKSVWGIGYKFINDN
ncbi:response regulator transcription factor [Poseidonibacter lekithochrous]|uniref:response regulator transcription factor n=1 Tax=Poseidonibacter lekithochrous TaxID=1904463 RepID=UPI000D3AB1FC|nr:response regulator transcription factor [Poseidonibacter lekithochrous]